MSTRTNSQRRFALFGHLVTLTLGRGHELLSVVKVRRPEAEPPAPV